jgi:hypothetical protein
MPGQALIPLIPGTALILAGLENLVLYKIAVEEFDEAAQRLDHISFYLATPEVMDEWFEFLSSHGVRMRVSSESRGKLVMTMYLVDTNVISEIRKKVNSNRRMRAVLSKRSRMIYGFIFRSSLSANCAVESSLSVTGGISFRRTCWRCGWIAY